MKNNKSKIDVNIDSNAVLYLQLIFNELVEELCKAIDDLEDIRERMRREKNDIANILH